MWSSITNWIVPFLEEYHKRNVEVTVVCNMDKQYEESLLAQYPFVKTYPISFPRGVSVLGTIRSIFTLCKFLKKNSFDLIQYSTPNASMYSAIAAKFAKVPVRLYCQWGMVYVTMTGIRRKIFKFIEKMVCAFSTEVQPDSEGNLMFCREQGFYDETKSRIIWNGSAKGLDLSAFDVSKKEQYAEEIRKLYGIREDMAVIGFVGRLGKEKGCNELFQAFQILQKDIPNIKLLFVGPLEKEETIEPQLLQYFQTCEDIIKTGRVSNVEKYTSAMDVFVLPSYREGFGMSVIEASAMKVPVVVTKYPGPSSAMKDEVTGYSVDIGDVDALVLHIKQLLRDKKKCIELGENGRRYVEQQFEQKQFIEKYMENRMKLLGI